MKDKEIFLVILVVFAVLLFGGMTGFGGMHGIPWACGHMGGIWCYWPSFGRVIQILVIVVLALFIIWLVKQVKEARQEPFIRTHSQRFTHSKGKKQ